MSFDWSRFPQNLLLPEHLRYPRSLPKLLIGGPMWAPALDYRKYDVLLLVALGIWATPIHQYTKGYPQHHSKKRRNKLMLSRITASQQVRELDTKHSRQPIVYPYWVTREQGSFDWFKGVMNEVAEIEQRVVIEMHNHLTSVRTRKVMLVQRASPLITMVQAPNHAENDVGVL